MKARAVLVTGAAGFIGKNLCVALKKEKGIEVLSFDINNSEAELSEFAARADFVFHLAGVNRPDRTEEFDRVNRGLTEKLLEILESTGRPSPVLFASSIQAALDNPYGVSKRAAEQALFQWSERTGIPVYIYRLPNVFGKWSKPNYNSVVATFCHNIARGLPIEVNDPDKELTLIYIDDVVAEFMAAMQGTPHRGGDGFCYIPRSFRITLKRLADTLQSFAESRVTLVLPNFEDDFERFLYATYTSYLPEESFDYKLELKRDHRGWLAEVLKSNRCGQIFISRTKPGVTRGNHWHNTKVEKFLVIEGEAVIRLRRVDSDRVIEYRVTGEDLRVVDIPVGYAHSITNVGSTDLITLFWAGEIFDPAASDTYYLEVRNETKTEGYDCCGDQA